MTTESLERTPLYEEHVALGARMVPFAGYEMPVQYTGIIEEHLGVRRHAGVFDVCHMAEFRVFGFGAFDFLQNTLTNDLSKIAELGAAQYTLMLDEDGLILDDLIVYHTGDLEYLIIANCANRAADFAWLQSMATPDIELVDESDRTALIAVQGPEAVAVLEELAGPDWVAPSRFTIREASLDGALPCLVARTGYTGEDGVEILCRAADASAVWRLLLSFPSVVPAGLGARDTLRLEMGYHLYGNDMDSTRDPISAGLGWVVPADKGAFVGKDAVERVRAEGPVERLAFFVVENGIPRPGFALLHEGQEVGMVASGTYSPSLGKGIGSAYVPAPFAQLGTELEVAIRAKRSTATVVKPPMVRTSLTT